MKEITIRDCEYMAERGFYAIVQSGKIIGFVKTGD